MSSEKFKGIWPLPGGTTEYVSTLTKILKRIQENNPTFDELLRWFMAEFKLKGEKTPKSSLEYLRRFGFFKRADNKLSLTTESIKFLESGDHRILYEVLSTKILGLDDILSWVSKEELKEDEIHKKLTEKYNLDWRTTAQTYFRLGWLQSLGYVKKEGRRYHITNEGLEVIAGKEGEKPPTTPSPVIPLPMEKYIQHAIATIEKHVTMSETNTISTLIEPLLEVLGWNIRDPEEVQREYPVCVGEKREYVDIALKVNNKPIIFIEAKPVSADLHDHLAEQLLNYSLTEGVEWGVLTNGREWRVYNPFWRVKGIEGKTFLKLSLDEFREKMEKVQLLSKESIISGKLKEKAELEHAKRIISEWLKQNEDFVVEKIKEFDPSLKEKYIRLILKGIDFSGS